MPREKVRTVTTTQGMYVGKHCACSPPGTEAAYAWPAQGPQQLRETNGLDVCDVIHTDLPTKTPALDTPRPQGLPIRHRGGPGTCFWGLRATPRVGQAALCWAEGRATPVHPPSGHFPPVSLLPRRRKDRRTVGTQPRSTCTSLQS